MSTASLIQEHLSAYYAIGAVLLALPSPVAKRTDYKMRWPESARLIKATRNAKERFMQCLEECGVTTSKREDLLLDVLPFVGLVDKQLSTKVKGDITSLCAFQVKGRMSLKEPMEGVKEKVEVKLHRGGWLEDDDIED